MLKNFKLLLNFDFLLEETLLFIQKNAKKFIISLLLFFLLIFVIVYFSVKNQQQKQKLLNQYVLAQNLISQKENAQALSIMQSVYNSSNGALEVLALISIMDLLLQDNQPQAVEKLLVEALTLKQEPEIMLILYSKCLNILQTLKTKKQISSENAQKISHDFQESLQKQKVPNDFTPYKTALLLAFSSDSSPVTTENLPQNELTTILQLIQQNK